jgi:putative restriction endonuclease
MDGFYANLWDKSQMAEARRNWTESEIAEAIDLYLRTPFGRIHSRNPKIVELAQRLNRTPGSIALKLTNLASIDESLDRKGMSNYSKLDKAVWDRFWGALSAEAARLPQSFEHDRIASVAEPAQARYEVDDSRDYVGWVVPRIVNTRQGQQYFRQMVLASYASRCAITGIREPELLVAGHIRSWAADPANRLNPRNGICLNRLHDRAFEGGMIAVSADWRILYSRHLSTDTRGKMESLHDTGLFRLPERFRPDPAFFEEHRDTRFEKEARPRPS